MAGTGERSLRRPCRSRWFLLPARERLQGADGARLPERQRDPAHGVGDVHAASCAAGPQRTEARRADRADHAVADEARAQYLPWIHQHPRVTLAACGLLLGLSALGLGRVRCDFNLLHLQAAGTESATWMQKILTSAKRSVLSEEIVAGSLDEVKRKSAALELCRRSQGWRASPR